MKRQRYVGDKEGKAYEVVTGDTVANPWTLVVCEDRPGIYSRLLNEVVGTGLVGTAMTVPFATQTVDLLTMGNAQIMDAALSIENLDQCVLVLDMDAFHGITDLLPREDAAFAGGELFHRLEPKLRDRTYLVSLKAPLDTEYYDRYPELTRIHIHPSLQEKKEDSAQGGGSTLSEGTVALVLKFIRETKGELDRPTFAPIVETRKIYEMCEVSPDGKKQKKRRVKLDENGNAMEERVVTKVTLAFGGSQPVDVKAMPGAHYLSMMLQHPGQVLSTAAMVAVRNPGFVDEREEQIGVEYDKDGKPVSEAPAAGGRTGETLIPDHKAIMSCCEDLTRLMNDLLDKSGHSAKDTNLKSNQILKILTDHNADADRIVKYIKSADYFLKVKVSDNKWRVSAGPSQRRGGRSTGERKRPIASGTIRKAIDRFLQQEVKERLPRLYQHILDMKELTDDSSTCQYKGDVQWFFGDEPDWRVKLKHIAYGADISKVQHKPDSVDNDD